MEEVCGQDAPMKSMYQWQSLIDRCGSGQRAVVTDVLELLWDAFQAEYITSSALQRENLRASKTSVVERFKLMLGMRAHLLTVVLPSLGLPPKIKQNVSHLLNACELQGDVERVARGRCARYTVCSILEQNRTCSFGFPGCV